MRILVSTFALVATFAGMALADDAVIAQAIGRYQDAFNRQDISTIESLWHETAVLEETSSDAKPLGRDAIIGQLREVFALAKPPVLSISIDSSAVQEGGEILVLGTNTLSSGDASETFAFTAKINLIDGKWQITRVTESSLDESGNQNSLQSIEWLLGVWRAVEDEDAVTNEFRYMPGNQFIVRTFAGNDQSVRKSLGYQVIGTLPGDSQLRSWTFLGDGSVSQADWIVEEERILIQSKGRLADGSQACGTYVLKSIDENTMTMKVVGHTISGEPVPSIGTVTLTRQTNSQEPKE